ncbi:polysaccharide biosynthesis tyrosine autokinase [Phytoactinopolyspora halotolerans]|uniref:Polysaccharide biosynthesis tyrosine autokinase n=1 Tax=Phytoactinopolyspora halotolerans TaxID=1981512 RepID=A0A6L9S4V0_9ACTN|nr:polysaccharide biosynthesis tyrosine autokinase [Phytoactinopolyspora halotolerans]NEE00176.1 polysaccharide biosynthesis tyrosine autokinase [Phytoactinopolyspora halotolerans]
MDLRSDLRLFREFWKLILAVTIVAMGASAFLTWRDTPQYASDVTMFVSASSAPGDAASAYQGSLLSQQRVTSYSELVRRRHVMDGVIERLELELTPEQLAGKVTASVVSDTSLLTATVRDASPERAQRIANGIGAEFVELVPELESVGEGEQAPVKLTVVSPAALPSSPVSPSPVRNLVLGGVLGMLVGTALALGRRALDTTIKTEERLEETAGAPVLGTVVLDSKDARSPVVDPASYDARAEVFRKIRANLHFVNVDRSHQVILVTSPLPGEGKSMTACNLAVALAEAEKRVVLVGADLRRPSTAGYLGLPGGVGLTSVLLGDASLSQATQYWRDELFAVVPSGPVPPNPNAMLASQRMSTVLQELRQEYDVVIVDSSPVIPVADAATLAESCDGALVVVRYGKTRREQLRSAVLTLQHAGAPVLGTVLNMAPRQRRGPHYKAYHAETDDYVRDDHERKSSPITAVR